MTISTITRTKQYNGNNSTTVFAYDFNIQADSELEVYLGTPVGAPTSWTKKTLTSDYTISGAGVAGGGNVTFGSAPPTGVGNVFIRRVTAKTQASDYVENDPFTAATLENNLDHLTQITQDMQEEIDRCFKLGSVVPDAGETEASSVVADRKNKLFAFDDDGDFSVTSEIGTVKGNWAASTAYVLRDIVKDTNNNNIYICITAHTSSGAVPISTNTDAAKWSLLVDAASATTSATAAATSATASASSATAAASSSSAATTSKNAAATSATASASSATAAASSATAAAASADSFDDLYLGAKSSDPSVDNDGDALTTGDIYFNTSANNLRVWNGSAWQVAAVSTSGMLANVVDDTTPQLGGFLDANGNYIQMQKGGDISSASPTVVDTDGDYFDVTGTTNFAAFTVAADRHFFIQFDGVLTMTHHATNLDLPGGANITTAAGDVAEFVSTAANQVQCVNYTRADGKAVVASHTATIGVQTIWIPALAMKPTNSNPCANLAVVETTSGRPDMNVLDFDDGADEHAQFQIAFPKSWNEGTITFQVYWCSTAADTDGVSWGLQGVSVPDNSTIDVAYGTAIVVDDVNQGAAEEMLVSPVSSALTIAGAAVDTVTFFRIFRDVSDANDTAAEDARLLGVKLFFTTDAENDA